ncbi:MFS transporter [Saccharothrix deserti]|uniref:MFS transporter n=1 Tax=Saccharothrix deserti TaxID=2593674 RepID=UPI00131C3C24|nr:MFS transporter [Saccharothrix deserti]
MSPQRASAEGASGSRRGGLVLLLLCAAQFMIVLDFSITNVALPTIQADLGFSVADLQWVVSAYALTFGGCLLLGGRIADLYGQRKTFIIGLLVFGIASLLAGFAQDAIQLVVLRGAQGLAAALVAPAALALLTTSFPEGPERNRALGVWGAVLSIGFVCGVIAGGVLTDLLNWRWVFFINVPIGLVTGIAAVALIAKSATATQRTKLDMPGAVTVTIALISLVYALSVANTDGWLSGTTLGAFVLAAVLLVAFVLIEKRAAHPLVPLSIFKLRALVIANVTNLALIGAFVGSTYVLTLYLQVIEQYTPLRTGLTFSVLGLTAMLAGFTVGKVAGKIGPKAAMVLGVVCQAVGSLVMATLPSGGTGLVVVLVSTALIGFGNITAVVMIIISATAGVPDDRQGLAGGLFNTSQQMGSALGVAVFAAIAVAKTAGVLPEGVAVANATPEALLSGYRFSLLLCGLLAVAAGLFVMVANRSKATAEAAPAATAVAD